MSFDPDQTTWQGACFNGQSLLKVQTSLYLQTCNKQWYILSHLSWKSQNTLGKKIIHMTKIMIHRIMNAYVHFSIWFHSIHFINDNLIFLVGFTIPFLLKISIANIFLVSDLFCYMNFLLLKSLCVHVPHSFLFLKIKKRSQEFINVVSNNLAKIMTLTLM